MGCAAKADGDALVVATFGEWDSRIEGGADMTLVAVVPAGLAVEHRKELSGPKSAGRDPNEGSAAAGWKAVPDEPDPDRMAR